jgi:hypothetical protein
MLVGMFVLAVFIRAVAGVPMRLRRTGRRRDFGETINEFVEEELRTNPRMSPQRPSKSLFKALHSSHSNVELEHTMKKLFSDSSTKIRSREELVLAALATTGAVDTDEIAHCNDVYDRICAAKGVQRRGHSLSRVLPVSESGDSVANEQKAVAGFAYGSV